MPEFLTYTRTLELLREVIAEFGEDHVYALPDEDSSFDCVYVVNDAPSCLVAQAIHRAGWPLKPLAVIDRRGFQTTVAANRELFEQWAEPRAVDLLDRTQHYQDMSTAWGEALRAALCEIGEQE